MVSMIRTATVASQQLTPLPYSAIWPLTGIVSRHLQRAESAATYEAKVVAIEQEAAAAAVEMEAAFVQRLETRVAAAVSVVQQRLEDSEASRASEKMAHAAAIAKSMQACRTQPMCRVRIPRALCSALADG